MQKIKQVKSTISKMEAIIYEQKYIKLVLELYKNQHQTKNFLRRHIWNAFRFNKKKRKKVPIKLQLKNRLYTDIVQQRCPGPLQKRRTTW